MAFFQTSVLREHLKNIDIADTTKAYEEYKTSFLSKVENIKTSKEEQYQYGFLEDIFVKVLGYTLNPTENYNLTTELKNQSDSKKVDGAILKDEKVIAVIELKSTKTKTMDSIVNQAFNYKNNHPTCRYIITSNFNKLRLYIDHSNSFEEFDLFALDLERFKLFYYLLKKENLFADIPLQLKEQSKLKEESISNELYKKYAGLRKKLFENLVKNNSHVDKLTLLNKTQTLLDRMVFIFFAEDRGILPSNTIATIIEHYKNDIEDRSLFHFYKIYFKAINEGNKKINITEYNGGLFAEDALLNSLVIDDEVLEACPLALSAYDFNTDIDVNILGHIFENSLSDIEEMKANIDNIDFDKTKTKRKKDGVFYTPEYITKYIVDNTLGKLCMDKKEELGLNNIEINIPKNPKKLNKGEQKLKDALENYREYLLNLKILDPACGSGAFLNQALNFLLSEHDFIDESIRTLMGGNVLGLYDVKKGILENNLYGVDINSEAVEIAKLSLWLRTVEHGRKLNILSGKIKVGNSLIDDKEVAEDAFVWEEEFPEVFEKGGFDVVIGNPPYVSLSTIKETTNLLEQQNFKTFEKSGDLYVLFYELGVKLLNDNGYLGYITSNKWMKAKYGKKLRAYFSQKTNPKFLIDLGSGVFESATVDSNILILEKEEKKNFNCKAYDLTKEKKFSLKNEIIMDNFTDDLWMISSPLEKSIKDKIEKIGTPLKEWGIEIYRGIVTGYNEAFIIDKDRKNELIKKDPKSSEIIKPLLRGKDIDRYLCNFQNLYQIATFPAKNIEIDDYPAVKEYLESFGKRLFQNGEKGSRKKTSNDWFETQDQISYYEEFEKDKIFYSEIGNSVDFYLDKDRYYCNNKLYLITSSSINLSYLLAMLNSKVMRYYFSLIFNFGGGKGKDTFLHIAIPKIENQKPYIEKANLMLDLNKTFHTKKDKFLNRINLNFDIEKLS